jgi:GNAT superfamily N-acetyltransferase
MPQAVRIEPLTQADVASAVACAVRVLRVKTGDRGEQFASDITDELAQMFVSTANGQVVGYGRVVELAAGEAGPGAPAGCYLSGVLVDPAWQGRGYRHGADARPTALGLRPHRHSVPCRGGRQCRPRFAFTRLSDFRRSSATAADGPQRASTCCRSW